MTAASAAAKRALFFAQDRRLRTLAGLEADRKVNLGDRLMFRRQAEAVEYRQKLIDDGRYLEEHLGVFAQEIGEGGVRQFLVDTFVGFALDNAPHSKTQMVTKAVGKCQQRRCPCKACVNISSDGGTVALGAFDSRSLFPSTNGLPHLYEVLLESRPCWLYFDLEYHTAFNPELNPDEVMDGFRTTLASFCTDILGATLALESMVEMDSSTAAKFSKHVLVQRLAGAYVGQVDAADASLHGNSEGCAVLAGEAGAGMQAPMQYLAFENNAQAGLVVNRFVAYARARRDAAPSTCPARFLFVRAKPAAGSMDAAAGVDVLETSFVDESVYSRNRCFRLLFHSKFGKTACLQLSKGGDVIPNPKCLPAEKLLLTMASLVRADIDFFRHPIIPAGYAYAASNCMRSLSSGGKQNSGGHISSASSTGIDPMHSGLLNFLCETWERVRHDNETTGSTQPCGATGVYRFLKMDKRYLNVTLSNNRFCFCKRASHKSNKVYLVLDRDNRCFYQKCFDIDCKHFRSPAFEVPAWLLDDEDEELEVAGAQPPHECGADSKENFAPNVVQGLSSTSPTKVVSPKSYVDRAHAGALTLHPDAPLSSGCADGARVVRGGATPTANAEDTEFAACPKAHAGDDELNSSSEGSSTSSSTSSSERPRQKRKLPAPEAAEQPELKSGRLDEMRSG